MVPIWINALAVVRPPVFVIMIIGSIRNTSSKVYQLVTGQYYVIQTEGIHTWPRRSPNPPKLPGIKHVAIYAPFSHAQFNMKLVLCCLFLF